MKDTLEGPTLSAWHHAFWRALFAVVDPILILMCLFLADIAVAYGTFGGIRAVVRRIPVLPAVSPDGILNDILGTFNRVSVLYIRNVRCIQRSTALTCLLRVHGIPAQFTVGCRSIPFLSHAWVSVAGAPVNEAVDYVSPLRVLDVF